MCRKKIIKLKVWHSFLKNYFKKLTQKNYFSISYLRSVSTLYSTSWAREGKKKNMVRPIAYNIVQCTYFKHRRRRVFLANFGLSFCKPVYIYFTARAIGVSTHNGRATRFYLGGGMVPSKSEFKGVLNNNVS